jgi:hypothetical protein
MVAQWQTLHDVVSYLEKVKPAPPELLELHVRAVGYLRGFLLVNDRKVAMNFSMFDGKERDAKKYEKQMREWEQS